MDLKERDIPLAYHEMCLSRADRRLRWVIVGWAVSLILAVATFAFMWLQYDYTSSTECTGVYNLVDADGNIVSADLTAEQVTRIMGVLHGEDKTDQSTD